MEVKAKLKYARTGVLKARQVARLLSGKDINTAMNILSLNKRKSGFMIEKLLKSAVAQAEQKKVMDIDNLYIKSILVNQGPHLKRYRPRARGSSSVYKRKQSHIEVVLSER
ncbi:MAG: 50S ribosomal protein L22 [Bdellovibrionales bacterium]|nr:50S ribosomal protein L22 [Bdellovibrionales bacterium]